MEWIVLGIIAAVYLVTKNNAAAAALQGTAAPKGTAALASQSGAPSGLGTVGGAIDSLANSGSGKDVKAVLGVVAEVGGMVAGAAVGVEVGKKVDSLVQGYGQGGVPGTVLETGLAIAGAAGVLAVTGGVIAGAIGAGAVAGSIAATLAGVMASASAFAGPFAIVTLIIAVVAYTISIFIADFSRLSYGQQGALNDYEKKWNELHNAAFSKVRADPKFASITDTEIKRALIPFTDGFMMEQNRLAYLKFMKQGLGVWGIGADDHGKNQGGMDRGYFCGYYDYSQNVAGGQLRVLGSTNPEWDEINARMNSSYYFGFGEQYCPKAEQIPYVRSSALSQYNQAMGIYRARPIVAKHVGKGRGNVGAGDDLPIDAVELPEPEMSDYHDIMGAKDPQRDAWIAAGRRMANVNCYVAFMKLGAENVQNGGPVKVAQDGIENKEFEGDIVKDGSGNIVFQGQTLDWVKLSQASG